MQQTGYIEIDGERIKVLVRNKKYSRLLKIRSSGRDGREMTDEQEYLKDYPGLVTLLKAGASIDL
jgi:hypothetical protein